MYDRPVESFFRLMQLAVTAYQHTDKAVNKVFERVLDDTLLKGTMRMLTLASEQYGTTAKQFAGLSMVRCFAMGRWDALLLGDIQYVAPPSPPPAPAASDTRRLQTVENVTSLIYVIQHAGPQSLEMAADSMDTVRAWREYHEDAKVARQDFRKKGGNDQHDFARLQEDIQRQHSEWEAKRTEAVQDLYTFHYNNLEVLGWALNNFAEELDVYMLEKVIPLCEQWYNYVTSAELELQLAPMYRA